MEVPIDFLKECFVFYPETGALLWKQRPLSHFCKESVYRMWNKRHAGKSAGSRHCGGYLMVQIRHDGKKGGILAHRLSWAIHFGYWPGTIDHANGVKTDNRICNLREATATQNAWNANRKPGTLPVGVVKGGNRSSRFSARIKVNKKFKHIGTFKTADEAGQAYAKESESLHGDFSVARRLSRK